MEDSTEKSKEVVGENDVVAHCPKSSPQEDSSTVASSPPATACPSIDQSGQEGNESPGPGRAAPRPVPSNGGNEQKNIDGNDEKIII